jgi:hypothetical protein
VNTEDLLDNLRDVLIDEGLSRGWDIKYAKFAKDGTQSLLVHAINVFSLVRTLGKDFFELADTELIICSLAGFLHDCQKARIGWQSAVIKFLNRERTSKSDFQHDDGSPAAKQELVEFLNNLKTKLANIDIDFDPSQFADRILNVIVYTHDSENPAQAAIRDRLVGPIDTLAPVVRLCDSIASIKSPSEINQKIRDLDLPKGMNILFDYHEIAAVRGLVSSFLNEALLDISTQAGFKPLLYFGNGVIYYSIDENISIDEPIAAIMSALDIQLEKFQNSSAYESGMMYAVIGPITQTKWPALHAVRERDIPRIVEYLSSRPMTNKESDFGEQYFQDSKEKNPEYAYALQSFIDECNAQDEGILATMISDFNFLVYIADFLKNYEEYAKTSGNLDEYRIDIQKWLTEELIDYPLEEFKNIGNTTKADKRAEVVSILWKLDSERLHEKKDRRKRITKGAMSLLTKVLRKYKKCAPLILTEASKNLLLGDIIHSPINLIDFEQIREVSHSIYASYSDGKSSKKRICNLCGFGGFEDAPAALFGDGSQKFSNFLCGGSRIGKGNKAQICPLCLVEATLRGFFFPSSPETLFVILPDLSLSPTMFNYWADKVESFLLGEKFGYSVSSVYNMYDIYKFLTKGQFETIQKKVFQLFRPTKLNIKPLAEHLQYKRDSPEKIRYTKKGKVGELTSFEKLAEAHLKGVIEIDSRHLKDFKSPLRMQSTSCTTPSHMFVFFRNQLYGQDKKESPSTIAIRSMLLAMIVSKLFLGRVIVVHGFEPVTDFTLGDRVKVPLPAPAIIGLGKIGVKETVPLEELDIDLRKLSALTLISMNYVEGLGKDRLLRLTSMNRGAILRRAEMEKGSKLTSSAKRRLIDLLDLLPAFAEFDATEE